MKHRPSSRRRRPNRVSTFAARYRALAAAAVPEPRTIAETVEAQRATWAGAVRIAAFWWGVPDVRTA